MLSLPTVVLFSLAGSCAILPSFLLWQEIGEINRKLPNAEQISYWGMQPAKMARIKREYRRPYAIVSRSDMNDAILKLQESENRVEQERLRAEEQQEQIRAQIGHNEAISPKPPASRAVN